MTGHLVEITEMPRGPMGYYEWRYWWVCECGDEGGPFGMWEFAWDSAAKHVREEVTLCP